MGNDCGLGVIYGLMYYIQLGRLASQHSCPRSKWLFPALRSWLLAVVLSGSLSPPTNRQYITNALTELAATSLSGATIPSVMPIDDHPDPSEEVKTRKKVIPPVAVI